MLAVLNAQSIDREHEFVMDEVVEGNIPSHLGFKHNGFEKMASGFDPTDGAPLEFMVLPRQKMTYGMAP